MAAITLFDQINKDKVINFCAENGKCSDCGNCCSNCLPLTQFEIKVIKKHIRKNHILPEHHTPALSATNAVDWVCPFRDEINKRCKIYEVRPAICKFFKCDGKFGQTNSLGIMKLVDVRKTFYPNTVLNDDHYQKISKVMLLMVRNFR